MSPVLIAAMVVLGSMGWMSAAPEPIVPSYLGGERRDHVAARAPSRLDVIWKIPLGQGTSPAYGEPKRVWKGAGWTGQPLLVREDGEDYLIQGAFDYSLRKIRARDGTVVWRTVFDDILKGTGTFVEVAGARDDEDRWLILQGSRQGAERAFDAPACPSLRAVAWRTGRVRWELDVPVGGTDSRDVDASPMPWGKHVVAPLENGWLSVLDPNPAKARLKNGLLQPRVLHQVALWKKEDAATHSRDLAPEASPARWRDLAVVAGGNGRVYLIDPRHGRIRQEIVLGGDIDGTPVVTPDGCVLVTTEQEHVPGLGGGFKIDPARPPERAVLWFEPAGAARFCHWQGGVIGSATHNGAVAGGGRFPPLAAWIGVDGKLVVVRHDVTDPAAGPAWCPLNLRQLPRPQVVFSLSIGGSIATPVWAADGRLVVPWDRGLVLLEYLAPRGTFRLLARMDGPGFDATPLVHDGRIYAASRDGWFYCLGSGK